MRVKVSKRDFKGYKMVSVGYCDLQGLLKHSISQLYSAGVNGWACDYYQFDGLVISTGYSPIGSKIDYKIIQAYESKANKIIYSNTLTYEQSKRKLNNLLNKFIKEVKGLLSWN